MKDIFIPSAKLFNEETDEFVDTKPQTIRIEHSLISVSKWESRWKKSFLSSNNKSPIEILDYVRCMTLTPNVDPIVYHLLSESNITDIMDYINDPMTATTFSSYNQKSKGKSSTKITTSEEIYYLMTVYGIPFECEKWHLNRLLTLIRIAIIKSQSSKGGNKMSAKEAAAFQRQLNQERRQKYNTHG